jgi:hypothetical protein
MQHAMANIRLSIDNIKLGRQQRMTLVKRWTVFPTCLASISPNLLLVFHWFGWWTWETHFLLANIPMFICNNPNHHIIYLGCFLFIAPCSVLCFLIWNCLYPLVI